MIIVVVVVVDVVVAVAVAVAVVVAVVVATNDDNAFAATNFQHQLKQQLITFFQMQENAHFFFFLFGK
jgi:hypothetical protein